MNFQTFSNSLQTLQPPSGIGLLLTALWYDAKGNWEKAHNIVDGPTGKDAAWVHAYLHRKEGDSWNANYWYRRAGKKIPKITLQEEWEVLVNQFLLHR